MLLGEILIQKNYCTAEDIQKALQIQQSYGGRIGNILMNMGIITEEQILEALSIQFDIPFLKDVRELELIDIPVKSSFLIEKKIFPVKEDDNYIEILTNDPLNVEAFSLIENLTGKSVKILLTSEENLKNFSLLLTEEASFDTEKLLDLEEEIEKLKELASEAPVIKMVNTLITKAAESNATDIHFESLKSGMRVRFRIDGILKHIDNIPENFKLAVITRLKLISGMNIAENRLPQDGRIATKVKGKSIDVRVSSVPTQFGESVVLRLLGKESIDYSLESLGFYQDHIKLIREIEKKPNGIFLTTGPTGSGKTTTLYSVLSELNSENVKIITVEDPIEYELKGINQIQIKPEINYTFANALRSILRQDPDIIMIGEIRDKETAEIAVQAALTGHLVLSTLHTNSALASITRLLDMGVEFFLLKATIVGVMAQRLVRKLCPYCSVEYDFDEEIKEKYSMNELLKKYSFVNYNPKKAKGCKYCNYTGYKGRTVIAEIIPFSQEIQQKFDSNRNFNNPNEVGYRSMMEDGMLKVMEGITSIEEVLRVTE